MEIKYSVEFMDDMKRLFSRNPWYSVPRWFKDTYWDIRAAWDRVFRGYDNSWRWNFHYEMTKIALANLKWLKEYHHGSPAQFGSVNPEQTSVEDADMHKAWEDTLQIMIDGFEAAKKMEEGDFGHHDGKYDPIEAAKLYSEHEEIFKKGMAKFIEYYFNLWD
jgi:hypothetical protein